VLLVILVLMLLVILVLMLLVILVLMLLVILVLVLGQQMPPLYFLQFQFHFLCELVPLGFC
jgi:hypothetical protein